jgi:hypothetical protein
MECSQSLVVTRVKFTIRVQSHTLDKALVEIRHKLEEVSSELNGVARKTGSQTEEEEEEIRSIYGETEAITARLKVQLKLELPPEFIQTPKPSVELSTCILSASSAISAAVRLFDEAKFVEAFHELRKGRNFLRFYLDEKRRERLRRSSPKPLRV